MNDKILMVILAICILVFVAVSGFFVLLGRVTRFNEESLLHIIVTRSVFVLLLLIGMVGAIFLLNVFEWIS